MDGLMNADLRATNLFHVCSHFSYFLSNIVKYTHTHTIKKYAQNHSHIPAPIELTLFD